MIVTKTPLRISFFGGGSDIPQYYNKYPGMVISTSIDKNIYIAANKCQANHFKIIYSQLELTNHRVDIKHDRIKAIMEYFDVYGQVELCSFSDIDTRGSGLGSSSTFTVGSLHAMFEMLGKKTTRLDLAELASYIEIHMCGEPIGKQDQYAAAFGGFNVIRFNSSGVDIRPVFIKPSAIGDLSRNLMCFNTGVTRAASSVLSEQVKGLEGGIAQNTTINETSSLVDIAEVALKHLEKENLDDFGALLDTSWRIKKKLSKGISNPVIDAMYALGINGGALGGKLLGAGGGGYMLFYVPENRQSTVFQLMAEEGYQQMKFNFTDKGSTVELSI
jgi:D-glycero-alpha-D-manno-heptose-7-phosphate kinase